MQFLVEWPGDGRLSHHVGGAGVFLCESFNIFRLNLSRLELAEGTTEWDPVWIRVPRRMKDEFIPQDRIRLPISIGRKILLKEDCMKRLRSSLRILEQ